MTQGYCETTGWHTHFLLAHLALQSSGARFLARRLCSPLHLNAVAELSNLFLHAGSLCWNPQHRRDCAQDKAWQPLKNHTQSVKLSACCRLVNEIKNTLLQLKELQCNCCTNTGSEPAPALRTSDAAIPTGRARILRGSLADAVTTAPHLTAFGRPIGMPSKRLGGAAAGFIRTTILLQGESASAL